MRSLITPLAFLVLGQLAVAQEQFNCGTAHAREQAIQRDPSILQREAQLEEFTRNLIASADVERDADTLVLLIPMVFHIIHDQGSENIPDANILDQVNILNRDYRKLNLDVNQVCCGFDQIAADIRVQFKLATRTPTGACTNGIDRIRSIETFVGDDGSKLNPWQQSRYLNVWVVSKMENGVAGYAYYPSAIAGIMTLADGVIILNDYIGSLAPSSIGHSRALTHEIGHFLNLEHPWGNTNAPGVACGDDEVEDTPVTKGWDHCPTPEQSKVCTPDVYENFENYMDYSYCSKMFTNGQRDRMRAALNSGLASRISLWAADNLAFTGVADGSGQTCAPQADFYPSSRFTCQGSAISFHDNSANGTVTTWLWNFQDGDPATSTEQSPSVSFSGDGWKTVTLTVSNDQGTSTKTTEQAVRVSPPWSEVSGLLSENFENGEDYKWVDENHELNNSHWERVTNTGFNSSSSVRLNAFDQESWNDFLIDDQFSGRGAGNDIDELISPALDLSWADGLDLTFRTAYASRATDPGGLTEKLEIYWSNTCGRTWTLKNTIQGIDLVNDGANANFFTPTSPDEWAFRSFPVSSQYEQDNVRLKFRFISADGSNNLYIDDINLSGNVGINENVADADMEVYPNPASSAFTVNYALHAVAAVQLSVIDASGRTVLSRGLGTSKSGKLTLDPHELGICSGVYQLLLSSDQGRVATRLVIE